MIILLEKFGLNVKFKIKNKVIFGIFNDQNFGKKINKSMYGSHGLPKLQRDA